MPHVSDRFGPYPVNTTLDGSGNGTVFFQAVGQNIRITNLYVSCSSITTQATATAYKGQIGPRYAVSSTNSGSTGASAQGQIDLFDGEFCYVVWSGGTPGAVATATFSGVALPFDQVKSQDLKWDDPIAAGDGSIVYPALKSPNYVAGVSGWRIGKDGTVEFNNGTFRGTIVAGGLTINDGTYITNVTAQNMSITNIADGSQVALFPSGISASGPSMLSNFLDSAGLHIPEPTAGLSIHGFDFQRQSGQEAITAWAAATSKTQAVTFVETYAVAPQVFLNIEDSAAVLQRPWVSRAVSVTTTGFTILLYTVDGSSSAPAGTVHVDWLAIGEATQ